MAGLLKNLVTKIASTPGGAQNVIKVGNIVKTGVLAGAAIAGGVVAAPLIGAAIKGTSKVGGTSAPTSGVMSAAAPTTAAAAAPVASSVPTPSTLGSFIKNVGTVLKPLATTVISGVLKSAAGPPVMAPAPPAPTENTGPIGAANNAPAPEKKNGGSMWMWILGAIALLLLFGKKLFK